MAKSASPNTKLKKFKKLHEQKKNQVKQDEKGQKN